jgi:hypothetical protein
VLVLEMVVAEMVGLVAALVVLAVQVVVQLVVKVIMVVAHPEREQHILALVAVAGLVVEAGQQAVEVLTVVTVVLA